MSTVTEILGEMLGVAANDTWWAAPSDPWQEIIAVCDWILRSKIKGCNTRTAFSLRIHDNRLRRPAITEDLAGMENVAKNR